MSIIKGSELMKALEEGELKEGQQVRFKSTITSETKIAIVISSASGLYLQDKDTKTALSSGWLTNSKIEIIEVQQDIDIKSIKELENLEDYEVDKTDVRLNRELINKILQWAQQIENRYYKGE